jgi:hypothetical protein
MLVENGDASEICKADGESLAVSGDHEPLFDDHVALLLDRDCDRVGIQAFAGRSVREWRADDGIVLAVEIRINGRHHRPVAF